MAIIISFLIFGAVVLIHEFGHYITAVKSGILVEEFAIGMGPVLLKKEKGDTLYTIRALPIGGFCKMLGEDEDIQSERAFNSKSVWARILVISGGVIMNTLLAFVIFFGFNAYFGYAEPVVYEVLEGYPADTAGLKKGDEIYSVDGYKIGTQSELLLRLNDAANSDIKNGEEPVIDLVYKSNGEKKSTELKLMKDATNSRYIMGFNMDRKIGLLSNEEVPEEYDYEKSTILETTEVSVKDIGYVVESTIYGLSKLFTTSDALEQVAGPVGIVSAIGTAYDTSVETSGVGTAWLNMLYIMGLISANLAVFNFLPFPALDGGRLVFLIYEAITGRQVPPEKEGAIHFAGFVVLLVFALVVTFSDIHKLF